MYSVIERRYLPSERGDLIMIESGGQMGSELYLVHYSF